VAEQLFRVYIVFVQEVLLCPKNLNIFYGHIIYNGGGLRLEEFHQNGSKQGGMSEKETIFTRMTRLENNLHLELQSQLSLRFRIWRILTIYGLGTFLTTIVFYWGSSWR